MQGSLQLQLLDATANSALASFAQYLLSVHLQGHHQQSKLSASRGTNSRTWRTTQFCTNMQELSQQNRWTRGHKWAQSLCVHIQTIARTLANTVSMQDNLADGHGELVTQQMSRQQQYGVICKSAGQHIQTLVFTLSKPSSWSSA